MPSNYVAPAESLEAQDWFCGMIRRAEAERSLANKAPGTFLIREAETAIGCYSMSGQRVYQNFEFFIFLSHWFFHRQKMFGLSKYN